MSPTGLSFVRERVLIWGKTYPELSKTYAETVCTAGVRENGDPIRLYPVPLRYLGTENQYSLYDWIDVPICKSSIDARPESFKVDAQNIQKAGHIDPKGDWAARAAYIFKDPSWQYHSMRELSEAQSASKKSLGIVTPGEIDSVAIKLKPKDAKAEYETALEEIQSQSNLFLPEYKELGFRPFEVHLKWRCATPCNVCQKNAHDFQVLDWGLMELARKNGWSSDLAKAKLEDIATSGEYDFKLFLGNTKQHQQNFLIVGLWYPKVTPDTGQLPLL